LGGGVIVHKMCVCIFSLQCLSEAFLILRRIERCDPKCILVFI